MGEDFIISTLLEKLLPFVRHMLYALEKAANDTPLSLEEAAHMMGINRATLKKRCQRGQFPYYKVGDVYYISKIDMNLYIKGGSEELMKYNKYFHPENSIDNSHD